MCSLLHMSESLPSDAAYWNSSNIPPKLRSPRVRQLKRTELAWRVGSAQCLRSPHKLQICGDPAGPTPSAARDFNLLSLQKNARLLAYLHFLLYLCSRYEEKEHFINMGVGCYPCANVSKGTSNSRKGVEVLVVGVGDHDEQLYLARIVLRRT